MGLGIANAVVMHIRDVKLGNMTAPVDEHDDEFEYPLALPADDTNPIAPGDGGLYVEDINDIDFDDPLARSTRAPGG